MDDIVSLVENLAGRTRIFATLDTLENLKKGGRIGGAKAMLGTMLQFKPCLDLSSGEQSAMTFDLYPDDRVSERSICHVL